MMQGMQSATAMANVAEAAFRFFQGLTGGVEIVTGGNYREKENKRTPKRADNNKRGARPGRR
jgi:hypothetical protein